MKVKLYCAMTIPNELFMIYSIGAKSNAIAENI